MIDSSEEEEEDQFSPPPPRRRRMEKPSSAWESAPNDQTEEEETEEDGVDDESGEEGAEVPSEKGDWDRSNKSAFTRRERRRQLATNAKASTWIKSKAQKKKKKENKICLSERGPRGEWEESWKVLSDDCSVCSASS